MIKPRGDSARKLDNYSHRQYGRAHATRRKRQTNLPALTSDDTITHRQLEARGDVGSKVLVSLLIAIVLLDEMQVVTTKNDRALHLGGNNNTTQNTTTDGNLHESVRRILVSSRKELIEAI
jgi:hypothetical protein